MSEPQAPESQNTGGDRLEPRTPYFDIDSTQILFDALGAQLAEMQRLHYEIWPEIPLPALNGRTPIDAVKYPDGREIVEALLSQFEGMT